MGEASGGVPPPRISGLTDLAPLGQGGFGVVYRAWQAGVGRTVALKVDSRVLVDERDRRRFVREASTAGRLSSHGHIVAIYDAGVTADGRPYLVMELCPGGSLADRVRATGPLPADEVARIGAGIADALATAHAAGVLHRDVKPGNILVDAYGVAKLADFGLAAIVDASGESSATRQALTPAYAPPEAFAFVAPAPSGDVYALGATLYALLAGRPPRDPSWPPGSFAELSAQLHLPVPPVAGADPRLASTLSRALQPDPAQRVMTAAVFRDELRALTAPVPRHTGSARRATPAPTEYVPTEYVPTEYVPTEYVPTEYVPTVAAAHGRRRARPLVWLALLLVAGSLALALGPRLRSSPHRGAAPASGSASPDGAAPVGATPPSGDQQAGADAGAAPAALPTFLAACPSPTAGSLCLTTPLCWGGQVISGDHLLPARVLDCAVPHYWETYAVSPFRADPAGLTLAQISARPEVAATCTTRAMARASRTQDTLRWGRTVQPQLFDGRWYAFCLAAPVEGGERTGSAFRPGPAGGGPAPGS
jgi:hypothetical protein